MNDDNLIVADPRIVDIEWETLYLLGTKNLNKLLTPRFAITLSILGQGDFTKGGAIETVGWSSKRNQLRLTRKRFECDY